jgi:hypothetical protein
MFILSLLLIVTGALVRNVLTIHSTTVDVRQVGSILIASGIGALMLKVAALALRDNRRARVPTRTEGRPDRPDAPRPSLPERPAATYSSTTVSRNAGDWQGMNRRFTPWRSMFDSSNRYGWAKMNRESSRPAPYRGKSMSDPRNPYGWTNPYSPNNPNSVHNRHDRMRQQMSPRHRKTS